MDNCYISKNIIEEFCKSNLKAHTDWTGTRVETKFECENVNEFIDIFWKYLEDKKL